MAGRSGALAFTLLALCLAVATAQRRAVLSVNGEQKVVLGDIEAVHERMMRDLKEAQEEAGIFVDDAHLFENVDLTELRQARKLQQTISPDLAALVGQVPLVQILSAFAGLPANSTTGVFPAAAFPGLTNANPFGYSPTNDSFCLFSTSPTPTQGRKLMQSAPSPLGNLIDAALSAIGLPIWKCVVATTPVGVTTVGDAAGAILNDLGLVAEHLLVYLNGNGDLTYQQNIINDFVSLQNPLYPSGPRINISIDFASVAKDIPILDQLFPHTTPSAPVAAPGVAVSSPVVSPSGGSPPSPPSPAYTTTASNVGIQVTAPPVPITAIPPAVVAAVESLPVKVFDGYLDQCQVVIGSIPHADGNFDRSNNFTGTIVDGTWGMTMAAQNTYAGEVGYIIPASKVLTYSPLTLATRKSATYCYDIASLQPVYNPLALYIGANSSAYSANPLSTVAVFGAPYGLTEEALKTALVIPSDVSIYGYDALGLAVNGSAEGLTVLKINIETANTVTLGATILTNDSSTYASYAIIMDQSIAKKILYSPPTGGRKLLQAPAVDLTNATTLASIITIGEQAAPTQTDEATRNALNQGLTPVLINAVATALANINTVVAKAPDATTVETARFYTETTLAEEVTALYSGTLSLADFQAATTVDALTKAVAATKLPGQLIPTPVPTSGSTVTPITQSGKTSSGGLSHGGKVALATVLPIVGVIAIVAAVAFYMTRRNRGAQVDAPAGGRVWWSSMFSRGNSASASGNTV